MKCTFTLLHLLNLHKTNISCSFTDRPSEVIIELPNVIKIFWSNGSTKVLQLMDIQLEPLTLSNLKYAYGNTLEMSLKATMDSKAVEKYYSIEKPNSNHGCLKNCTNLLLNASHLLCGFCDVELADISSINKVELSEALSNLPSTVSDFFCHVEDADNLVHGAKHPAKDASLDKALLSARELYLPKGLVKGDALLEAGRGFLRCASCYAWVGRRHLESGRPLLLPATLRIRTPILDSDGDQVDVRQQALLSENDFVSGMFRLLLSEGLSKRFILLSVLDDAVEEVALLWLIDGDLQLYSHNTDNENTASDAFLVNISPQRVQQVMYSCSQHPDFSSLCESWSRDMSIVQITLPQDLCLILLEKLISSTESLSNSLQTVQQFYNAFISC